MIGGHCYFRYIRRHHLYHHSRHGARLALGLTSHVWDAACGTRADRPLGESPREMRETRETTVRPHPRRPAAADRHARGRRAFPRCRRTGEQSCPTDG